MTNTLKAMALGQGLSGELYRLIPDRLLGDTELLEALDRVEREFIYNEDGDNVEGLTFRLTDAESVLEDKERELRNLREDYDTLVVRAEHMLGVLDCVLNEPDTDWQGCAGRLLADKELSLLLER